jgi:hypothetical protein
MDFIHPVIKQTKVLEKILLNNDNKLNKVLDESIINNLLAGAKDAGQEVFIWRLIGGAKYLANVMGWAS